MNGQDLLREELIRFGNLMLQIGQRRDQMQTAEKPCLARTVFSKCLTLSAKSSGPLLPMDYSQQLPHWLYLLGPGKQSVWRTITSLNETWNLGGKEMRMEILKDIWNLKGSWAHWGWRLGIQTGLCTSGWELRFWRDQIREAGDKTWSITHT